MTVTELETRCEATEKEIAGVKAEITLLHQKLDEQKLSESIHATLKAFMVEIIGRTSQPSSSVIGELSVQKGKGLEQEVVAVGLGDHFNDRNRFKKGEMLVFAGMDLESWLFWVEQYFEIQKLTDTEKVAVAMISFDDIVLAWYRYTDNRDKFKDWNDLKSRLRIRFRLSKEGRQCA